MANTVEYKPNTPFDEKTKSDALADKSEEEIYDMKCAGKIVYRLRKTKDGKHGIAKDGTVYAITGALRKVGMVNGKGEFVPLEAKLSKRERSKMKRNAKKESKDA